jgi:hypothetical protein
MKSDSDRSLEERLRADSDVYRARARTGLARDVLARMRDAHPRPALDEAPARRPRRVLWLAAAAAALPLVFLARAWLVGRPAAGGLAEPALQRVDTGLIVRPLGRLLALDLTPIEEALAPYGGEPLIAQGNPLSSEARKIWLDASHVAQQFASQLPSPLREALVAR